MKSILTPLLLLFFISALCQQRTTVVYDAKGNIIGGNFIKALPPHPVTLKDSVLNYTFVLDSSHITVTAYDSLGKVVWKTDPYLDSKIWEYRTKRPIIVDIVFGKGNYYDSTKS